MLTITRRLEFDAGHRVLGHEGKCANLHGHRYQARVTVTPHDANTHGLDELGRVIDFSVVKTLIGGWIDANWDHNMLLHSKDPLALMLEDIDVTTIADHERRSIKSDRLGIFGREPYVMPEKMNPTAENLARVLFYDVCVPLLPVTLRVVRVRIYETPNCYADCTAESNSAFGDGMRCTGRNSPR